MIPSRSLLSLVFLLAAHSSLPVSADPSAEPQPLRVAFILPLSGDAASFGQSVKNGSELALAELPPELRGLIEPIYEDDQFSPTRTLSAYQKIKNGGGMDLTVVAGSSIGNALAPVTEKEGMPLIAIASDPAIVQDRRHVVNFWVTPREEAALAVPEAIKRGYKKIARVATIHAFPLTIKKAFDARNAGQMEVVLDEEFQPDVRDFRAYLSKVRNLKGVDAILVLLMPGQVGVFAKQTRELGIQLPLFNFEFFEDPNEVRLAQGALEGGWYVSAATPAKDFVRRYLKRFPDASLFGAANGYDTITILAEALLRGAARQPAISRFLREAADIRGVFGVFSAAGDGTFTLPAGLKIVRKNGFEDLAAAQ